VKINPGKTKREGFTDRFGLQFENGLRLYTEPTIWLDRAEKEKIEKQFAEVLGQFVALGVELGPITSIPPLQVPPPKNR